MRLAFREPALLCLLCLMIGAHASVVDESSGEGTALAEVSATTELATSTGEEPMPLFHQAIEQFYLQKNFTEGIRLLHQAVDEGDDRAMSFLALFYTHGIGVTRSEARALVLYEFAALSDNIDAHLALSHRYERGIGVPESCEKAVRHAQAAANHVATTHAADITAKVHFVDLERETHSADGAVEGDLINAHYFRAEKGQTQSKVFLGYAYMLGLNGVEQNGRMAEQYFLEAAEAGDSSGAADGALGQLYVQGMSSADPPIEVDYELALKHFRAGAARNHPISWNGLGYMYASGKGVEQDFQQAAQHFKQSAAQNNAEGIYNLGVLHLNGKGVPKDANQAAQHFLQAALRGSVLANWQLGHLNLYGKGGVPKSCSLALRNYRLVTERGPWVRRVQAAYDAYHDNDYSSALLDYLLVAENGLSIGLRNAAFLLERGLSFEGVQIMRGNKTLSQDEAVEGVLVSLLQRAAREGSHEAHLKLGDLYYRGIGGEPSDLAKAEEHYQVAASANNPQALFNLGLMHQFGGSVGLRQDFHLAKRFYDQALAASPSSYYAVNAALYGLNFHWWWLHYTTGSFKTGGEDHEATPPLPVSPGHGIELSVSTQLFNLLSSIVDTSLLPTPFGLAFDTFVLYLCIGLCVILLLLRHHAVEGRD